MTMKRKRATMKLGWDKEDKIQLVKAAIAGAIVGLAIAYLL